MMKRSVGIIVCVLMLTVMILGGCSAGSLGITAGNTQPQCSFGIFSCEYGGNEYYIDDNAVYENGEMLFEGKYLVNIATDGEHLCVNTDDPETLEYGLMVYDLNRRMLVNERLISEGLGFCPFAISDGKIYCAYVNALQYDLKSNELTDITPSDIKKDITEELSIIEWPIYSAMTIPDNEIYEEKKYTLISRQTGSDILYSGGSNLMYAGVGDDVVQIEENLDDYTVVRADGTAFSIPKRDDGVFSYTAITGRDASSVYLIAQNYSEGEDRSLFNISFRHHLSDYAYILDLDSHELKEFYESGKDERIISASEDEIITMSSSEVFRVRDGEKTSLAEFTAKGSVYVEISGTGLYIYATDDPWEYRNAQLVQRVELG